MVTPAVATGSSATSTKLIGMRLAGTEHLERVIWRDTVSGAESEHPIRHLFLMTGASPASEWLKSCLALDSKGSF